jgi:hypothetical protein
MKKYLVDGVSKVLFYVPPTALWEFYVANMEIEEVAISRSVATGINLIVGGFQGKIRDYAAKKLNLTKASSEWKKTTLDTCINALIGSGTYASALTASGASLEESLYALPFGVIIATTTGRPYGWFQDKFRMLFNINEAYRED